MTGSGIPATGPCGPARLDVDSRCAEAERLAQASVAHQQRLRDTRLEQQQLGAQRDADARVRDRRQLSQAKDAARVAYHQQMVTAPNRLAVQDAARTWLREVDRLNRQLVNADLRAEALNNRAAEIAQAMPGIELAADAARIAAESAQEACVEARRVLAACEEETQRRVVPAPTAVGARTITLVLRGDRDTLLNLALRLAEETGVEAGRLQLLLLELREAIAARALDSMALGLPADHHFWGQLDEEGRRRMVASLAAMGYRFDGVDGWVDERVPKVRELALAISHTGLDPRTLRRPMSQQHIDELWRGTTVLVESYLVGCAPALELEQVITCLGPRAAGLSELWDMWGRLRPMLLAVPSA